MFNKAPEHVMKTIDKENNILGENLTLNIDYKGTKLTVKRHPNMGHLNGYINVPTNITEEQFNDIEDHSHGGITYDEQEGDYIVCRTRHCTYFGILIDKPKEIPQVGFAYPENTNAYEMITAYSDITAIDIIYEDETNEYIYVDFNEYNDNYNINQKNEYYNNTLEVTITESNSIEEEEE